MSCWELGFEVKVLKRLPIFENQLPFRYCCECDVVVYDHPTDLGLCYAIVMSLGSDCADITGTDRHWLAKLAVAG